MHCLPGMVSMMKYTSTQLSTITQNLRRRDGLIVSALVSGSSGPGSSHGRWHCVVFSGKTLNSHSAFLHPWYWRTWASIPPRDE